MNAEFPVRTEGEVTLPDGTKVWLTTLNTPERQDASEEAEATVVRSLRAFRPKGASFVVVLDYFEQLDREESAAYVAQVLFLGGGVKDRIVASIPDPAKPERDADTEDVAYADAMVEWEDACKQTQEARQKAVGEAYDAEVANALALSEEDLLQACGRAYWKNKYLRRMPDAFTNEVLFRAVRKADDHAVRFYASVEQVAQLNDPTREMLSNAYFRGIDTVDGATVPTSPGG